MNMQVKLRLGEFGNPRIAGRVLVVLCSYRGGTARKLSWRCPAPGDAIGRRIGSLIDLLTLYPLRAHAARMRDYFANPRLFGTQLDLAQAALASGQASSVHVLIDAPLVSSVPRNLPMGEGPPEIRALDREVLDLSGFDTVLLVYADPLGLSFGPLESRVLAEAPNVVVVNGRRRLFPLTHRARRALRWRRILATTRIPELAMAVAVISLSAALVAYDWLRRRT